MAKSNAVIIKRVKKSAAGGHGGAWKVAYADFVTAMMAFFLLLWLLNATTNAQKRGIADYFAPSVASKSTTSGSGGVLGGQSPTEPGSQVSSTAPAGVTTSFTPPQDFQDNQDDTTPGQATNPNDQDANSNGNPNASKPSPNPNAQMSGAGSGATGAAAGAGATGQQQATPTSSANPFLPFHADNSPDQAGNPFAGQAPGEPPAQSNPNQGQNQQAQAQNQQAQQGQQNQAAGATSADQTGQPSADAGRTPQDKTNPATDQGKMSDQAFQKQKAEQEEKQFEKAQYDLQQAIQQVPDLKPLARNLVIDRTEEGLRIQIVDQEKTAMFATGSTAMSGQAQKLIALVTQAISKLPNSISITGHTDSTPFFNKDGYSNWDLSSDRANAARRALVEGGFPPDRIATVVGKADTDNLIKDNSLDPRNRRISIVVLRNNHVGAAPGPAAPNSPPAGPDDGAAAVIPPPQ